MQENSENSNSVDVIHSNFTMSQGEEIHRNYEVSPLGFDSLFTVKIEDFEGPLDLLLHLVKKNELELEKVSLALVANQYLECLKDIENIDIELAGEYLVIASTLVSIKSSILLNEPVELIIDEDGQLVDPHDLLLIQLKEAQIYKDGVEFLNKLPVFQIDVFSSKPSLRSIPSVDAPLKDHDAMLLGKALKKVLAQNEEGRKLYHVTLESVSVADKMSLIIKKLNKQKDLSGFASLTFKSLIESDELSYSNIIATFISLLELCKRQVISVFQDEHEIKIALAKDDIDLSQKIESEFDRESEGEVSEKVVNN